MSFVVPPDHQGCTIWLTGLSGSGKTTIARKTKNFLERYKIPAKHLDGDRLRRGINRDLGFSKDQRSENIRRVAEIATEFAEHGSISLVSLISPYAEQRNAARAIHQEKNIKFFEVYVNTPIEICEIRDPKQLYRKARDGKIPDFTGVSAPYEEPSSPDLLIDAGIYPIVDCCNEVLRLLVEQRLVPSAILDPVDRHLPINLKIDLVDASREFPKVELDRTSLQWAQVIAEGWATPLEGFMREHELLECLHFKTLTVANMVHSQSIPIVLPITNQDRDGISILKSVSLTYQGKMVGYLTDVEVYQDFKRERCARTFGSVDANHPTIKRILESDKDLLLGGRLQLFERIEWNDGLDKYRLTPQEIKHHLVQMKADAVFVFQLRNPLHNGHVLLINETFTKLKNENNHDNPILLLHPIGGWTKDDDVPLEVRMRQHQVLLDEGVLDRNRTILSIFPSPMLYAGPGEVQWHAKARLVAGIEYYIVGRDPAGVKDPSNPSEDLYNPTHGAKVLDIAPGLQALSVLPFRVAALNKNSGKMELLNPDSNLDEFENISGTKMRQMAAEGLKPPEAFMNPKAWEVLASHYRQRSNDCKQDGDSCVAGPMK